MFPVPPGCASDGMLDASWFAGLAMQVLLFKSPDAKNYQLLVEEAFTIGHYMVDELHRRAGDGRL
jgi:hypothetical protein